MPRCPSEEELAWEMQMSPVAMRSLLRMERFTEVAAEDTLSGNGLVTGRRARSQGGRARVSKPYFSGDIPNRKSCLTGF